MTKRRKLKICLLLHEKLSLQSMQMLCACVKRFMRRSEDGENVQTNKYINSSLYSIRSYVVSVLTALLKYFMINYKAQAKFFCHCCSGAHVVMVLVHWHMEAMVRSRPVQDTQTCISSFPKALLTYRWTVNSCKRRTNWLKLEIQLKDKLQTFHQLKYSEYTKNSRSSACASLRYLLALMNKLVHCTPRSLRLYHLSILNVDVWWSSG